MKKIAAAAGFVMLAGAASAADLPVKAPPPAAAPPCVWCGFYAGVNAGDAWSGSRPVDSAAAVTSVPSGIAPTGPVAAAAALNTPIPVGSRNGFTGGGQIGYNFQIRNFVAGLEADIQGLSGRSTGTAVTSAPIALFPGNFANATLTATNSVNWLGTVRGRIGLAVAPNFLLYGTGGLAYGGVRSSTGISEAFAGPFVGGATGTFPALGSFSQTRAGWTAGAGGEWKFTGNWSARFEYLHYDLGSATYGTTVSNFGVLGAPAPGALLYTLGQTSSVSFRGDIVRVGLNYQFGAAPVAAGH